MGRAVRTLKRFSPARRPERSPALRYARTGRVGTKRVYEPKEAGDGTRVLVMRLWPRGVKKSQIHVWLKELGAELALLKAAKAGRVGWPAFRRRYRAGLRKPAAQEHLEKLRAFVRNRPVTLLCACRDESRCHRSLLKQYLARSV